MYPAGVREVTMKTKTAAQAALIALLMILAACEQPTGGNGGGASPKADPDAPGAPAPAALSGVAVTRLPDISVYGKGQPFETQGLVVTGTWDDQTERVLQAAEYSIENPPDTNAPGLKEVRVRAGDHGASFSVYVNTSGKLLQSVSLSSPPSRTQYEFGQQLSLSGMVLMGNYSDGSASPLNTAVASYSGYDRVTRGTQSVTVTVNRLTAAFNVTVRIPASAVMQVNNPDVMPERSGVGLAEAYRMAYVKGTPLPGGLPEYFEATVRVNGVTRVFKAAAGEIIPADLSPYNPNTPGPQTLTLTLDDKTADVPLYVIDVEKHAFFDYGYWRHAGNPSGAPPIAGAQAQYTVPLGQSLTISPVVFALTEEAPSAYVWSTGLPHTVSGPGNRYLTVTPVGTGNYTADVTVTVGGSTLSATANIVCTAERPGSPPPAVTSPAFNGLIPPVQNEGAGITTAAIRNFAPGQFTQGGTGYGWSLGGWGGYEVWKLRKLNEGATANIHIGGNPIAAWREPGIVWVSVDDNQNGVPDDTWYELQGGDDLNPAKPIYRDQVSRNYAVYYIRDGSQTYVNGYGQTIGPIHWVDSKGRTGSRGGGFSTVWGVDGDWVIFAGTALRDDGVFLIRTAPNSSFADFNGGYVDEGDDYFNMNRAVRSGGGAVTLPWIDFVKVHTGIHWHAGIFGEVSTEIGGGDGLGTQTSFPDP